MVSIKQLASGAIERDVMEEEGDLPNIDEADNENQLVVVEYVQDIYHFYWYTEVCPFCHGSLANCFCSIQNNNILSWKNTLHLNNLIRH
jgi:hypothetical protein